MGLKWLSTAVSVLATFASSRASPPPSPIDPTTDRYGYTTVVDDYRWLEQADSARVKAWVQRQNSYARSILDPLPDRDAIRAAKHEMETGTHVFYWNMRASGGIFFALKDAPPNEQSVLVALSNPDDLSTERTIVDPNALAAGGDLAISWYRPSPDGRFVAVCLSDHSERGEVRVFNVATGQATGDVVPRVNYATAGGTVSWLTDSRAFLYTRYPRPGERPDADLDYYTRVYRHTLGSATSDDTYELGNEFPKLAEIRLFSGNAGWQFARLANGDSEQYAFYERSPEGHWSKFLSPSDGVAQVAPMGDRLLLLSTKSAQRGEVLIMPLHRGASFTLRQAKQFAAEPSLAAIQSIVVPSQLSAQSRVLLVERDGGPDRVEMRNLAGEFKGMLTMPAVSELSEWADDGERAIYCVSQYVAPMQCYRMDNPARPLAISERSSVRLEDIEVVRQFATSADGTRVPMTILHRKDIPLQANTPTVMTGYGEPGGERPWFNLNVRLLADAGVTWVDTNVRGGTDYGMAWQRDGEMLKKQHSFDDFVACAQRLVGLKYTDPNHLVIEGSSAGGLLVGAAMTQHPELFRAVVGDVGIYDMLRVEMAANGHFNTQRYGSVHVPEQFRALYAYSPYHHVVENRKYPDVLFLASATDSHVDPMHSRKMTARMQAATKGNSLVLLRTSSDDGHGTRTAFSEQIEQDSDSIAFEFFELGVRLKR